MKTEEKTMLPAEIQKSVDESGMELNIAETIASYYVTFFAEAKKQAQELKKLSIDNPEDVEKAKRIRIDLGKICSNVAQRKKDDKNLLLIQTRYIDGLFKTVEGFARLTQKEAEVIEKHAERIENERLDKIEDERKKTLERFEIDPLTVEARSMSKAVWDIYIKGVSEAYTQRKEAEAKAEAERIKSEKRRKIFDDRKNQIMIYHAYNVKYSLSPDTTEEEFQAILKKCEDAKQKSIDEHKAREVENARLKKEAEEAEKEKKAEDERRKAEDEKKRKDDEKRNTELEELRKKEEARIEEMKKKIEEEKKEHEAFLKKQREDAKAPDLEKINLALLMCALIEPPNMEDQVMKEAFEVINDKFESFKNWAKKYISDAQ